MRIAYWLSEAWTELKWRWLCRWWMADYGGENIYIVKSWGYPRQEDRKAVWGYIRFESAMADARTIIRLRRALVGCIPHPSV